MTAARTLPAFPSDLSSFADAGQKEPGEAEAIALAGRVLRNEGGVAWIADAFAAVCVNGTLDAEPGDLVVVSAARQGERLLATALLERHRPVAFGKNVAVGSQADPDRFIRQGVGQNLRARARAVEIVRTFFADQRFLEVDTPLLVPSPGLDLHLDAVEATGGYLVTSPEYQMKRLLCGGVPRLFQMSHVFRRGEVGARHNPEFMMLEWYRAFAGIDDVMHDTERLVAEVVRSISPMRDHPGSEPTSLVVPFVRLGVKEAFERFAGVGEDRFFSLADHDDDEFFRILVDRVEPALASLGAPVFLVDYPISQASLARPKPGDCRLCERFELYFRGVELCNGFGELTDPIEQRRRLVVDQGARRAEGKPVYPIDERFLAALEEGMPPSAGNALGIDRLIAVSLGELDIARVMPFPSGLV